MADVRELWVWMNGERVGTWQRTRTGGHRFVYEMSWIASPRVRPLSLSLPLTPDRTVTGPVVAHYFDNLLPDDERIRRRVSARFKLGSIDVFELLQAIGRDCVGAVQLLPPEQPPTGFDQVQGEPMDDQAVARHLFGVAAAPGLGTDLDVAAGDDPLRISIAGAQEKTALLRVDGQWYRPLGATPTTHILKLPLGLVGNMQADMRTSVYNEWLCLKLMGALGFEVANANIVTFSDHPPVLAVERFDRRMHPSGTWLLRLPQEDFCQALGVTPAKKYEADGGPGIEQLAQVLNGSQNARADLKSLLSSQVAFWLLAATDGHAKNFSIRLFAGGSYALTPMYDVLSAWPIIGNGKNQLAWRNAKLAMALSGRNRHYDLATIMRRHFNATAAKCGWGDNAEDIISELLARVEPAIEAVTRQLPPGFPQDVAVAIFEGVRKQVKRLEGQPST